MKGGTAAQLDFNEEYQTLIDHLSKSDFQEFDPKNMKKMDTSFQALLQLVKDFVRPYHRHQWFHFFSRAYLEP